MSERENLIKELVKEKRVEQNETLKILDALRRTRKSRGEERPLDIPSHLSVGKQTVILTDALGVEVKNRSRE